MAYPHILYVYCVDSINTSVTELIDGYDVEYTSLPCFSDFNKYKLRSEDWGPLRLLSVKLEDLGAFYSENRVIQMEK